ncbi:hypothetical protein EYC84_002048 [Monilinia fructicola]|uniref:Uncharacterized protein n=1 Tax=Monilinia fructicola TaxID=38448 RepID=A0A5M9JWG7_MONFR|nr:hypothetical protein EYC84_002048 [Monilinia fructicola]
MFARILNASSKDCLQSDDPLTPSQQLREESRRTRSMVTTRGRARELADTPSVNGDSIVIDEGTPVPKRRGRPRKSLPLEDDEIVETPRPTRSSSKLLVQASDEEGTPKQQSPQVVDEIPASDEEVEEANESEKAQTTETEKVQSTELEAQTTESEKAQTVESEEAQTVESEKVQTVESEKAQTIEADEEVVKTTAVNGDITTSSTTNNHHKPEPLPEDKPEVIDVEDREDESSDDDAPEEVTTNQAAESAKEKEREAAKAIEEQEAASKKKRQEKDALLKRQSEASSKKRKLDLKEEILRWTRNRILWKETEQLMDDWTLRTIFEEISRTFAPPGHLPLPDLLPAEYLEDDDKPEPTNLQSNLPTRFAKPSKLRHILEKRPKDKRVGSTTFRVAENRNSHLPPKASNQARALKESWLQGRAGSKIKPNRKPFNQGFIKPKN